MKRACVLLLLGTITTLTALSGKGAIRYTVTELTPPSGWDFFEPRKLNNRGEMIGHLDASTGPYKDEPHAAFYGRGTVTDLHLLLPDAATSRSSLATALNDSGVGIFYVQGTRERSMVFQNGRLQEFNDLVRRTDLDPTAINNAGQIVGATWNSRASLWERPFLYADSKVQILGKLPGFHENSANAINNLGQIAGNAHDRDSDENRAIIFVNRRAIDLGLPPRSYALDINDAGHVLVAGDTPLLLRRGGSPIELPFSPAGLNNRDEVVGSGGPWPPRAQLYSNGTTVDLNEMIDPTSGWLLIYAFDINDSGQIAGWGRVNDHWAGFLLTPLP